MGVFDVISEFYDKASSYLTRVLEYLIVLVLIAILAGGLFTLVVMPPAEGGTSSGGVQIIAPSTSYQYGAETFVIAIILGFTTLGAAALFRASIVYGQKRFASALGAFGIAAILIGLLSMIYVAHIV
jgi:hypothetical protein